MLYLKHMLKHQRSPLTYTPRRGFNSGCNNLCAYGTSPLYRQIGRIASNMWKICVYLKVGKDTFRISFGGVAAAAFYMVYQLHQVSERTRKLV